MSVGEGAGRGGRGIIDLIPDINCRSESQARLNIVALTIARSRRRKKVSCFPVIVCVFLTEDESQRILLDGIIQHVYNLDGHCTGLFSLNFFFSRLKKLTVCIKKCHVLCTNVLKLIVHKRHR